jgi:NitT/TauT family transport system permease protein
MGLLLFWELGARILGSELIFPGPLRVGTACFRLIADPRFFASLGATLVRVVLGVATASVLGVAAGAGCALDDRINRLCKPLFTALAATPVLSVILILFLMAGQERTPVITAFLMVFPVMAANTMAGIGSVDPKLRELFRVYRIAPQDTLRCLLFPAILPFIIGGLRGSLSLGWKVVVAAEVLVQPLLALGTGMQNAKAHLETPELFAWTAGAVAAAAFSQALLGCLAGFLRRRGFRL